MTTDAASPARRQGLLGWLTSLRLHYVTWLLIVATLARITADTVFAIITLKSYVATFIGGEGLVGSKAPLALAIASVIYTYSSSIGFFAAAAAVEYLYRIWTELKARRA